MKTGHTNVHPGKRVIVWFRDGRREVDVFLKNENRGVVVFRRLGGVRARDIKTLSFYKGFDADRAAAPD